MGYLRSSGETKWPRDLRGELVNAIGALTTMTALAVVYALAQRGNDVMKLYVYRVVPAGAIAVGVAAASGYAISAWYTGLKMSRRLVVGITLQLAIAYVIAQYELFRSFVPVESTPPLSFWEWFDEATRAIHYAPKPGEPIEPLGLQGYLIRAFEIVGFTFGGWLLPATLAKKPYCDPCRTYKRTSLIAWLASGQRRPVHGRIDCKLEDRLVAEAKAVLGQLFDHARTSSSEAFLALRDDVDQPMSSVLSLSSSLRVELQHCPRCFDGTLVATLIVEQGAEKPVKKPAGELALDAKMARALSQQPSTIGVFPMSKAA